MQNKENMLNLPTGEERWASMFTEESLRQYPEVVKAFTGIPSESFWEMMRAMAQQADEYERERHERAERKRAVGGERHYEHSLVVRVAMVLTYRRLPVPQAVVALLYGCHQSAVSRALRRPLPLMSRVGPGPELGQRSETVAAAVVDGLPLAALREGRVLVAAPEQRVSRATDPTRRDAHSFGKRKTFTLKTQWVTTGQHPSRAIRGAVPGRVHDKPWADAVDTVQRLPDGCEASFDKVYPGLTEHVDVVTGSQGITVPCFTLKIPFKKPKGKPLSAEQKAFNHALSAIRVRIEHGIGWLKNWAILANRFRCAHGIYTPVFQLVCGLVNAQTRRWQSRQAYCA
jgi:hypothetical protein